MYYKNSYGAVYWLDHESEREFIPADCVPITDAEADELRKPTPTQVAEAEAAQALAALREIDIASIRSIREYIVSKPDSPQWLKDREAVAQAERAKLR